MIEEKINNGNYSVDICKFSRSGIEERKEWRKEDQRLMQQFKIDALKEFDLTNHPKANIAWNIAWEEGYASGLQSVLNWLDTLSELL